MTSAIRWEKLTGNAQAAVQRGNDLAAEHARLDAAGVPVHRKMGREEWGGVISTFEDPDGHYFQRMEFKPPA